MKEGNKGKAASNIDWELLLRKLKNLLLKDEKDPQLETLLEDETVWSQLPSDKALQWSEIAQAAGKHDLGLKVLESALTKDPDNIGLWEAKTKLLEFLLRRSSRSENFNDGSAVEDLATPFTSFRRMEKYLEIYMSIFKGKEDAFARQWADRQNRTHGYYPVRRPLTEKDVQDHLEGKQTYGIYLLHRDNTVSVAVIDADCDISLFKEGSVGTIATILSRRILTC
jgi:tetratricopeptide (TPR) repeat protein